MGEYTEGFKMLWWLTSSKKSMQFYFKKVDAIEPLISSTIYSIYIRIQRMNKPKLKRATHAHVLHQPGIDHVYHIQDSSKCHFWLIRWNSFLYFLVHWFQQSAFFMECNAKCNSKEYIGIGPLIDHIMLCATPGYNKPWN